ncbi:hypothetical protein NC653_011719 [Populus alba x Populus x berolinensis]|uniref:SAUR family protein n=1 Tax=Populus alba x Populus x berolinensis TaxID=444605 RepID=A0AAD6R2T9_9ROSI|nr:hypothetical protein NC653_011719 [Populus alba x Populus x berolinensis]
MAISLPSFLQAKQNLLRGSSPARDVRKGYVAVYVGEEEKKRFVIPVSNLNLPSFHELLSKAEEEFGFDHQMGGLTIPCRRRHIIVLHQDILKSRIGSKKGEAVPRTSYALHMVLSSKFLSLLLFLQNLLRGSSPARDVRKGYVAVYVGEEEKKRFVIPVSHLNQPSFQELPK